VPVITSAEEKFPGIGSTDFTAGRASYELDPLLVQNFFLECLVKFKTGFNTTAMHVVGVGDSQVVGTWNLAVVSSKVTFAFATQAGRVVATGGANVVANTWYHLSVSRVGNTFYLFLNGVLIATATSAASMNALVNLTIGDRLAGNAFGQYPTRGYFGAVRIQAGGGYVPPTTSFAEPTEPYPE